MSTSFFTTKNLVKYRNIFFTSVTLQNTMVNHVCIIDGSRMNKICFFFQRVFDSSEEVFVMFHGLTSMINGCYHA